MSLRILGFVVLILTATFTASAESPAAKLWAELAAKRTLIPAVHQEFTVVRTLKGLDDEQTSTGQIILDLSGAKWRERYISGSCNCLTIFDGVDTFEMQEGEDEYTRTKSKPKALPVPGPYTALEPDWSRATETGRQTCAPPLLMHECVIIQIPIYRRTIRSGSPTERIDGAGGVQQFLIDTVNGLMIVAKSSETATNSRSSWRIDTSRTIQSMSAANVADDSLFTRPTEYTTQVKELTVWDPSAFKKQLAGHLAPDLNLKDMQGNAISLASLRGKTVLLDFWATWCPPCKADAPALNKLFAKYQDKGLAMVGISVSEERATVEKYLRASPDKFPVALTTENELPLIYKVRAFPTYIVIDPAGTVSSIYSGDKGLNGLRDMLRKAGLELD